jgi:aminoglycoside 3-N-acetyltransferase
MVHSRIADARKRAKRLVVKHLLSYDVSRFSHALDGLGLHSGSVVMVHASWRPDNGFCGRPVDLLGSLKSALGRQGLLVMPSLTYQNQSSKEFLKQGRPMNVRRSPSHMGLLSEVFRRGAETRRSLSPTHPLLAWGDAAEAFLRDHDKALVPFGPDSPFRRLLDLGGKILTFDAPFSTVTFTHFLEDRIASSLPFPLYEPEPVLGTIVDYQGATREVPVKVLSLAANALRREERLVARLEQEGVIIKRRIGNTRLLLMDTVAMTDTVDRMVARGESFFDTPVDAPLHPQDGQA